MAAPSYTTDLNIFDDAADATNWTEATGMLQSGPPDVDPDLAIYGSQCITADRHKTGLSSIINTNGSVTLNAGDAFFVWHKFFAPNSLDTKANGGVRILIGSGVGDYRGWYVDGSNTYPYGGWKNYAIDPTDSASASQQQGSPTTTRAIAGCGWNSVNAVSKGNPMNVDIIRYGRGQLLITDGDLANGYANFDSAAIINDNPTTGRWGLFQDVGGSYLWKGLFSLGSSTTSVDFRDANKTITIDNTEYVDSDFNKIEISNTSSNVEWTGITISSLSTRARGNLEVIDNATVSFDACTFNDMGTFKFNGGTNANTLTGNIFRRCQSVTMGGASITDGEFSNQQDSAAVIIADSAGLGLNSLTTDFIRPTGNTSHAVKVTDIVVGDISRDWNNTFTGYTGGTAGTVSGPSGVDSAVLEVNVASGSELTLNISPTADIPSVQNLGSGDVTVVAAVTVTLTGIKDGTEARIFNTGTTTELAGVESLSGGVGTGLNNGTAGGDSDDAGGNSFAFSTTVGTGLDIRLINIADWVHDDIINYIVPSGGGTVPISSRPERVYRDPD